MKPKPKVMITGAPGSGRTELLLNVVERIKGVQAAGFVTLERKGAKGQWECVLKNLKGEETVFARQMKKGRGKRVGKYFVDVDAFEEAALEAIAFDPEFNLYIIGEIGVMQVMSKMFCETAKMLLKSEKVAVLSSITKMGHGFIREIKRLSGVETIELNGSNNAGVEDELLVRFMTALIESPEKEGE